VRPYTEADQNMCLQLYSAVEKARQIPPDYVDEFTETLNDKDVLTLVGVMNEELVACGSINYYQDIRAAFLSYGLVHPEKQKMGIGSIMLITRIALLASDKDHPCYVYMSATSHSRPFFTKVVGFGEESHDLDEYGNIFHNLYLPLSDQLLKSSRRHLSKIQMQFDWDIEVPIKLS